MSQFPHLRHVAKSDLGLVRGNNEDAFGAFQDSGIFCVADGMGGGDDGEFASSQTVASVSGFCAKLDRSEDSGYPASTLAMGISSSVNHASALIMQHVAEKNLKSCGSTFVGVIFDSTAPDTAVVLHAGDSRLYRYRNGELKRLTRDHSVAELMGVADENSVDKKLRGVIVRAVGTQNTVDLEQNSFDVQSGDRVFLCTDGLTRMVKEDDLSTILARENNTGIAVDKMIDAAKQGGGIDNITVVLIDVGPLPLPLSVVQEHNFESHDMMTGSMETACFGDEDARFTAIVPRRKNLRVVGLLGVSAFVMAVGLLMYKFTTRSSMEVSLSPCAQLSTVCDADVIKRFERVVRMLDRHGIPDGFEDKARKLKESASSEIAEDFARDVILSVKSGVDYARDCAESKEILAEPRTERLRRFFASLSSELDGNPADIQTQNRCAALIQKIAAWD